ncbi:allene oxide synthase-lipoxygenase protein-like [Limulus polyphemus]|uniref:Allene oxide synthase-lipoxygenase protein-like n=1 Tax=Limulus polyphemus TaxID=6850 RepID=A0ABM1SXG0_LIMPO|nr:allene oxide synthase-lipoxygenase protein-like [Limulus polyphemus]
MAEQSTQKYEVHVVTGDRSGAGTDANVWLVLHDDRGQKSSVVELNNFWKNDHERNTTGKYKVTAAGGFGQVIKVEFWRDSYGLGDDWFLDRVEVHNLAATRKVHYFPVHRWVVADVHYVIHEFDCTLPEDDHSIEQRQAELQRIRDEYRIHFHVPGGPAQLCQTKRAIAECKNRTTGVLHICAIRVKPYWCGVLVCTNCDRGLCSNGVSSDHCIGRFALYRQDTHADLPVSFVRTLTISLWLASKIDLYQDQPTSLWQWDIIKNKGSLLVAISLINLATKDKWESFEDLKTVYRWNLEEPECIKYWTEDKWFGLQRIQGANPILITLCTEIPSKFKVDSGMLQPFLEGLTLEEALAAKRLFIVDHKLLENINCKDARMLTAPIALFFLNETKELMPIAIQLFQDERPKNPVSFTHLLMEGVVVCTHRNLSPSHPLFKLMAPHFLYLLAINAFKTLQDDTSRLEACKRVYDVTDVNCLCVGLEKLLSVNGWVDQTMTVGRCGMFELIKRSFENWRLDVNGIIPNDFKARKVDDPNVLPNYPYRDDSTAIFKAIRNYVTKVVKFYYDDPQKVINDVELQHWREELVLSRNDGGVGLLGVPGETGKFTTIDQVIDVVSVIISTCSIGHAAANFQQYSEYGFPPNYPGIVCDDVIQDKRPRTMQDVLKTLPDKETTLDIMVITKLLSARGTKSLGDFEVQYLYHPVCVRAAEEFRAELREISKNIQQRNKTVEFPYCWLDPEIVPNSISI